MTPKEVIIAALNPSSLTSAELYKYADAVLSALSDAGMRVCRENHDAALAEVARLALELERLRTENDVLRMKLASAQMLMSIARAALRSEGETP